jgi:hypothetical protein
LDAQDELVEIFFCILFARSLRGRSTLESAGRQIASTRIASADGIPGLETASNQVDELGNAASDLLGDLLDSSPPDAQPAHNRLKGVSVLEAGTRDSGRCGISEHEARLEG